MQQRKDLPVNSLVNGTNAHQASGKLTHIHLFKTDFRTSLIRRWQLDICNDLTAQSRTITRIVDMVQVQQTELSGRLSLPFFKCGDLLVYRTTANDTLNDVDRTVRI